MHALCDPSRALHTVTGAMVALHRGSGSDARGCVRGLHARTITIHEDARLE